jgi:hypothetical protein
MTITTRTTPSQTQKRLLFFAATLHLPRPSRSRSLAKANKSSWRVSKMGLVTRHDF